LEHLFNSSGEFIAFRRDRFVWNHEGDWIGWRPWDERDVVTTSGEYLGTIFPTHVPYVASDVGERDPADVSTVRDRPQPTTKTRAPLTGGHQTAA
jgi:hypothetical protein